VKRLVWWKLWGRVQVVGLTKKCDFLEKIQVHGIPVRRKERQQQRPYFFSGSKNTGSSIWTREMLDYFYVEVEVQVVEGQQHLLNWLEKRKRVWKIEANFISDLNLDVVINLPSFTSRAMTVELRSTHFFSSTEKWTMKVREMKQRRCVKDKVENRDQLWCRRDNWILIWGPTNLPFSSSSIVVELSVDSLTSPDLFPLALAIDRAEKMFED